MAGDGILQLGATVDKTGVDQGLNDIKGGVQNVVQSIAVQAEETTARTKAAWNKLGDDVKAASQNISAESLRVAEATKAQTEALADLRRASVLSRDAKIDEAQSTSILAAAQQKAAAAAAEVSAAKRAEAEAVATAAEEETLSENALVAAFQRANMAIGESLAGLRERLVLTGETADITARDITGAFSGLGELLGIGLLAGFAGHYLDDLAKLNVELDHLSAKTGIGIQQLAGLQEIAKETGSEFEPISTGLVKMERAIEQLADPSKTMVEALQGIGLKVEDLKNLKAEDALEKIATAFAHTSNQNAVANAALALFGRGGAALIPILREQGAALDENIRKTGALTGITDESAEAARRWTADTARLSAQFRSVFMPVMEHAEDVVRRIVGVFDAAAAAIVSLFELAATAAVSAYAPLFRTGVLLKDIFTANWGALKGDVEKIQNGFVDTWKAGFDEIRRNWQVVSHDFTYSTPVPKLPEGGEDFAVTPPAKNHPHEAFQRDEAALNQLRLETAMKGYRLDLDAEVGFWEKRLAAARKGSDEYKSIVGKLAELKERQLEQMRHSANSKDYAQTLSLDLGVIDFSKYQAEIEKGKKEQLDAARELAEGKMRLAQEDYQDFASAEASKVRLGKVSAQEQIADLRAAAEQKYQMELQQVHLLEALDLGDMQKHQQDLNREMQIEREHARQMNQLAQQSAELTAKVWQQAYQKMTTDINNAVAKWVVTGKGFEQSMAQMLAGITENFTKNVMKMTEQFLMGILLQKQGQKSQILGDAKTAAANAYSAVSAIPVVGPFLAPPAAAAAFAGVMAFDSFDAGGVVGNKMGLGGMGAHVPVLAEAGERVLTPKQTANFDKMVSQPASTSSALHLNLTQNVNTYDRTGMRSTLRAHADDLLDIVQGGIASGRLKYA